VCLTRQIGQFKDFLFSLHSGELNSIYSHCSFYVPSPWGETVDLASQQSTVGWTRDALRRFHEDETRVTMMEYVQYVLARVLLSRPFKVLAASTVLGVQEAEILYDLLLSSREGAVWALRYSDSLDKKSRILL
jgi:hypothetical protein